MLRWKDVAIVESRLTDYKVNVNRMMMRTEREKL